MKKLTLSLDSLRVQSYDIEAPAGENGTVLANSLPTLPFCTRFGCVSSECPTVPCTKPEYFCLPPIDGS
jgi:hypothetical protein